MRFLFGAVLFFVVFYDRNLLITYHLPDGYRLLLLGVSYLVVFTYLEAIFLYKPGLILCVDSKNLIIIIISSSAYYLFHEFYIGDQLISLKYSVLLFLVFFIIGVGRGNYSFVLTVFSFSGSIVSVVIIIQQFLLMLLYGGNIGSFEVAIFGSEIGRWRSCDFVNPFGMGYFERCDAPQTALFGMEFNRSLSFSREPKYISSVILATLSSLFLSQLSRRMKYILASLHYIALLFVMSFASYAVILMSLSVVAVNINRYYYVAIVMLFPVVVIPYVLGLLLTSLDPAGILSQRLYSASGSFGVGVISFPSLFGTGVVDNLREIEDSILYKIYGQYGLVSYILLCLLLLSWVKSVFEYMNLPQHDRLFLHGLFLGVNSVVVYNLYFFSDIYNYYFVYMFVIVYFMSRAALNNNIYAGNRLFITAEKTS